MVMEASPSPQCVGREFVRQYYTLLNKAPNHLHRFYNTTSSFVHGGLDTSNKETKPAIGQKQIHQKIQQLNFRDCHAKITQVDSQATLGNGVVVQVSGELSNAGQPMRRFTQTFVLGAQAPKKYYVHNDIFRYQDFGFPDEEEVDSEGPDSGMHDSGEREIEEGGRSEPEEDEQQNQVQQISAPIVATEQHTAVVITQPPPISGQPLYYPPAPQHVHSVMPPVINGSVHEDASLIGQQPLQQSIPPPQQPLQPQQQPQYISEPVVQEQFTQEAEVDTSNEQQPIKEEAHSTPNESHEHVETENFSTPATDVGPQEHSLSAPTSTSNSGPKTYANLVKSSFPGSQGLTNPQPPKISMSPPPITNFKMEERSPSHPPSTGPSFPSNTNVPTNQQPPHRVPGNQQPPQQQQQQRPPRSGPMQRDGERRSGRPNQFTDAHQLFLGNVPHHATESDLRQLFERYGRVAELRVHSKQNDRSKGPQGPNSSTTRVPNYGFITFEDSQVVAKVLNDLPIYYPDENGQIKLNVEEKKIKPRMSMDGGGGRPSTGGDNMRSMGGQQQQQQQRGPGGPGGMRGGGSRGGPRSYPRSGGEGGRGGGGMRQPGNPSNQNYANRR